MKTYYLHRWDGTDKKEYVVQAQNKTDLRKAAYGKIPDGKYSVHDAKGVYVSPVTINKRTNTLAHKKHNLSKEEYNKLYFYIGEGAQKYIEIEKVSPLSVRHSRKTDSINDIRKIALAQSYNNYRKVNQGWDVRDHPVILYVYKGTILMGEVYCSPLAKPPYKGTGIWMDFKNGGQYRLFKDGSIEKM